MHGFKKGFKKMMCVVWEKEKEKLGRDLKSVRKINTVFIIDNIKYINFIRTHVCPIRCPKSLLKHKTHLITPPRPLSNNIYTRIMISIIILNIIYFKKIKNQTIYINIHDNTSTL